MSNQVTDTPHIPLAVPVRIMPSQQKLLEQLHYLTTFHNNMVILAGPEGAGKSTLLEVFLEQASDYANLAYLSATPRLTLAEVRERLFQQISSLSRAQPDASLSKTIRRALPDEPQHLMLVVDDAHTLEPAIIDELQDLVLHSRFTGGKHRISVVVTGTTDWAARQRKVLPSNTTDKPEIVLIPELDDNEALAFAKALLMGHDKGKALAMDNFRIQAALGTCLLYPGIIQDQLQELVSPIPAARYKVTDDEVALSGKETKANKKATRTAQIAAASNASAQHQQPRRNGMRLFLIMSVFAFFIATAATAWLNKDTLTAHYTAYKKVLGSEATILDSKTLGSEPEPLEPAETLASEKLGADPTILGSEPTLPETTVEVPAKSVLEQGESQVVMNYDEALPRLTEAARNFQSTRNIELNLIAEPTAVTPALVSEPAPVVNKTAINESVENMPTPQILNNQTTGELVANTNPWLNSHNNAYFLNASPQQVVLQVGAVSSQTALNRFLENLGDVEGLMVYHTLKNERSWYVIVTGNYASLSEARSAVASLPSNVQGLQPWAKPVEWIQNELAVVVNQP